MVPPEPAHHLRQHRTAHVVAVDADAPGVIDVVAFRNQRLLEPHILVEPVARLVYWPSAFTPRLSLRPSIMKMRIGFRSLAMTFSG